jgi:hypothetical protein
VGYDVNLQHRLMPEPSFAALRSLGAYFRSMFSTGGMLVGQQIVLNSKGAADDTLRICIDEKLRIENHSLIIKSDSSPGFSCVVADTGYTLTTGEPVTLEMSPFVAQW